MKPKRLTTEQAAIVGAYTRVLCGSFNDLHEYIERKLKRSVQTAELPSIADEIKTAATEDFLAICADQPR